MNPIWCNGRWFDGSNYPGSAQDRGAILGLGLFETMLAVDAEVVFATRHLRRLQTSAERLGWDIAFPDFTGIAAELLSKNRLATGRARLRLAVTAGSGTLHDAARGGDSLVSLSAFPAGEIPDSLQVCLSPWPRNERSPLAGLKSASYAENVLALDHARRLGCGETVILNTAGALCEAATANLFLVKGGEIFTPARDSGCLPGIGREVVLELATENNIAAHECNLSLGDLHSAEEIFLTSSLRGPVPVTRVDDRKFAIGTLTVRLRDAWNRRIAVGR